MNVTGAAICLDNASATGPCAPAIAADAGASGPVEIRRARKLNNDFTLNGAGTMITLDFDGDQSVRQTQNGNENGNGNGGSNGALETSARRSSATVRLTAGSSADESDEELAGALGTIRAVDRTMAEPGGTCTTPCALFSLSL